MFSDQDGTLTTREAGVGQVAVAGAQEFLESCQRNNAEVIILTQTDEDPRSENGNRRTQLDRIGLGQFVGRNITGSFVDLGDGVTYDQGVIYVPRRMEKNVALKKFWVYLRNSNQKRINEYSKAVFLDDGQDHAQNIGTLFEELTIPTASYHFLGAFEEWYREMIKSGQQGF